MKTIPFAILLFCMTVCSPAQAEVYVPTAQVGEFLRQFGRAYRAGDREWFESAVDKDGIPGEAKGFYFGLIGPNGDGEIITDLAVVAAPEMYKIPNSLLDFEIEATIPVDFLIRYQRTFGGIETTVQIPAGYRDGRIRLVGMKRK